jgi:starch synthase
MGTKKILYIAQEITPYLPDSPIATTCRYLPQAIQEKGREIRTFMPKFGNINERRNQLHEVIRLSGMNLIINDTDHPLIIKVASIQAARMQIYFIDNEDYFKRKYTIAGDDNVEFGDNDERSIFYIRGVLETIKKLRWIPDVIDCHGWMTALTGLYIKTVYADDPCFKNTKIVYSLYKDDFKQPFNPGFIDKLKFDGIKEKGITELKGAVDYETLSDLAIKYADGVIQSEESINKNILDQVNKAGKKFLPYQGGLDVSVNAINDFYGNL